MAIPRKLRTSLTFVGCVALSIAAIFLGSGEMPLAENTKPKKEIEDLLNSHFFLCNVRLISENFWHTASSAPSCSAYVFPKTMMSSLMLSEPEMLMSSD